MHDVMPGMMWGMGLRGIVLAVPVILVIAALIKFLFFR
jgi:hypothetical protein